MADEKVILDALSSTAFKVSAHDKKQVDDLETEAAEETKKQFGEDSNPTASSDAKKLDTKSLLSLFKSMSSNQRNKVIDLLKQNGLGDPLTQEKLVQNSFTVGKIIRDNSSK